MERDITSENRSGIGVDWSAAVKAGLVGGLVFLILEMGMVALFMGKSPWGPPRMIAAIAMGRDVLPPPPTFQAGIVMVAMILHFIMSVGYALILALLLKRVGASTALIVGAVFGLVLYLVNFYGFTAIFPWFAMARNWVTIVSHIMFGLVTAWAYRAFAVPRRALVA